MNKRLKLILTRPLDESLEAFIIFRKNTILMQTNRENELIEEDLYADWINFWNFVNIKTNYKDSQVNKVN